MTTSFLLTGPPRWPEHCLTGCGTVAGEPDGRHRPYGSSLGVLSPTCHKTAEEGVCFPPEDCFRPQRACKPKLGDRLVALARPGEEQAEVVPHRLAGRKAADKRPELRERRRQIVHV